MIYSSCVWSLPSEFACFVYCGKGRTITTQVSSGGFRVGGAEARLKKGPSDDFIILRQP